MVGATVVVVVGATVVVVVGATVVVVVVVGVTVVVVVGATDDPPPEQAPDTRATRISIEYRMPSW